MIQVKVFKWLDEHIPFSKLSFKRLRDEFELYQTLVYPKATSDKNNELPWTNGELSLRSFFLSSLIRSDKNKELTGLFEYAVKNGKSHGRADLFLKQNNTGYLIETKYYDTNDKKEKEYDRSQKIESWYKRIFKQAKKYLDSDIKDKDFIVVLGFDVIHLKNIATFLASEKREYHADKNDKNEFYALYYDDDNKRIPKEEPTILSVYGRLQRRNE